MAHIDLVALQQRLAQQQPQKPTPGEPQSWSIRPAPTLRTASPPKGRPASAASAGATAGTLRATTTMRAPLPLEAMNTRAERAKDRTRANVLQAQIDELSAEMALVRAEADRALAEERRRANRLNEQVEVLLGKIVWAEQQAEAAVGRAERAEAERDAERSRADALRATIDELRAEQVRMAEIHICELAIAQGDAQTAQQAAEELRQSDAARELGGRWARLRAAWRRE